MAEIDQEDEKKIKAILSQFYGSQVEQWPINDKVYIELVKLIQASHDCTVAMNFVPRPYFLGNPISWLTKEIRKAVLRFLTTPGSSHYIICMRASALARKPSILMAVNGL